MQITATEVKNEHGQIFVQASGQDIFITKNGQRIAKLIQPLAGSRRHARQSRGHCQGRKRLARGHQEGAAG